VVKWGPTPGRKTKPLPAHINLEDLDENDSLPIEFYSPNPGYDATTRGDRQAITFLYFTNYFEPRVGPLFDRDYPFYRNPSSEA
jgi:hypothetical protein